MLLYQVYRFLTIVGYPFIYLYLLRRRSKGKEDSIRFNERLGIVTLERPKGFLIWIHAASVGESLSALPLICAMCERFPDKQFLLTTGTVASAQLLAPRLPHGVIHQYIPVDSLKAVQRFLDHWQPNLVLWLESEFWPNVIMESSRLCPVILVNGRITQRATDRWKKAHSLIREVICQFTLVLPQSVNDQERLKHLGAQKVLFVGNLKYDAPPLPNKEVEFQQLKTQIANRRCWIAASTHEGEEEQIIIAHRELKEHYPDILTILVPRHASRGAAVRDLIKQSGLSVAMRSCSEPIYDSTDIYLADTLGELGLFFRLVGIAFIGGSLIEKGGHNPLEPARLDCAIVFGESMYNFSEIAAELIFKNAAIEVHNGKGLAQAVGQLFDEADYRWLLMENAKKAVLAHKGAIEKILNLIESTIQTAI
ncbi:MAG: 3-deoxy-D-manno-octulosonic acid transferase [Alphaproteobacteria bacterium]|nr:3-deoxy-D-manno-octulosonic acid transferase [Alphaproteobacteria bacterium]